MHMEVVMKKIFLVSAALFGLSAPVSADPPKYEVQKSHTETSKTTTVTTPAGKDWHAGVEGTTKYTQPSKGPDGPEPGHQAGSSQNSSGTIIIQKRF